MSKYNFRMIDGEGYIITKKGKRVPPSDITRVLNTKWGRIVKQINPHKNSLLLVRQPKEQKDKEFAEALKQLADEILIRIGVSVVLVGLQSMSDFRQVDEKEMEKIGWVRSEKVLAFVTEKFADINERLGEESEKEEEE